MLRSRLRLLAIVLLFTGCPAPGGVSEALWALALDHDTVYAPGYTDEAFARVAIGMTEEEVIRRLGSPIDPPVVAGSEDDRRKTMRWTRPASNSNYKCRVLHFRNGRVSGKHAEFYVD